VDPHRPVTVEDPDGAAMAADAWNPAAHRRDWAGRRTNGIGGGFGRGGGGGSEGAGGGSSALGRRVGGGSPRGGGGGRSGRGEEGSTEFFPPGLSQQFGAGLLLSHDKVNIIFVIGGILATLTFANNDATLYLKGAHADE
jgi:hypothetical protein